MGKRVHNHKKMKGGARAGREGQESGKVRTEQMWRLESYKTILRVCLCVCALRMFGIWICL